MKTFIATTITIVILIMVLCYLSYSYGRNEVKIETIERAKKVIGKQNYTDQDIEYIIFEESQF